MTYEGQTHGNVVVPEHPLPFPDGTLVRISLPVKKHAQNRPAKKSVAETSFGLIQAELETVQRVLEEEFYET